MSAQSSAVLDPAVPSKTIRLPRARSQHQTAALRRLSVDVALTSVLLLLICVPRVVALDRLVTPDESLWLSRSANFFEALAHGDLEDTYQFVHPGVTVMWAGTVGYLWEYPGYADDAGGQVEWRSNEFRTILSEHGHSPLGMLVSLRLVLTLFSALVLAAAFLSAMALVGRWTAAAGFILLALDPFHISLTRLLHLDGLSTNLLLLAVIAFLNYVARSHRRDLAISGVAAGLAWLTRSADLVLGPFFLLIVGIELARLWRDHEAGITQAIRHWFWSLAAWSGIAVATFVALWPAMWVSPIRTLQRMVDGSLALATEPHGRQIFFAGDVWTTDPGWPFYLVTFLWRTTPVVLIGLFLAAIAVCLPRSVGRHFPRRPMFQVALFALMYAIILTIGDKKLDRYLLPSQAALDLVAGAGWLAFASWLWRTLRAPTARPRLAVAAVPTLAILAFMGQAAVAATAYPYFFDYYNPLLGGANGARDAMMVGWGEGMDVVADRVNALPDAEDLNVICGAWTTTMAYYAESHCFKALYEADERGARQWAWADYRVLTFPEVQRQLIPAELLAVYHAMTPIATIELNGMAYAWIYDQRNAPFPDFFLASDMPIVDWGATVRNVATTIADEPVPPGEHVRVPISFEALAPREAPLAASVRLVARDGTTVAEAEKTLSYPAESRRYWQDVLYIVTPADTEPGTYDVILTVYDKETGQPLPATWARDGTPVTAEVVIGTARIGVAE